jgi:N-sulfoglucosamine sulfohydrolase
MPAEGCGSAHRGAPAEASRYGARATPATHEAGGSVMERCGGRAGVRRSRLPEQIPRMDPMKRWTSPGRSAAATLCCALLALGFPGPAAEAQRDQRPNIVWLSAEDLSPRLGAYGDPVAATPSLDRLAREGTRFDRAFVSQPICAPSRSAIITGMYQTSIGTLHMRTTESGAEGLPGPYLAVPPHYVKAFPEYLRAAGYYTTNNSKTDYQFGVPFTIWDENGREAHWRNRPDPGQPFFAVFNDEGTHESQVWPHHPRNRDRPLVTDPSRVAVPPYYPDTRTVRESLARHYDNLTETDRWAGEILRQLEEDGLLDNTIVFFWGDHGDGLPRAKRWLYDSGLQVPLLVRWPGVTVPGSVNDELVSLLDLAPTVLAMAGVARPVHLQGRVIVGPEKEAEPEYLFASRDRVDLVYDMVRSVRDRRYKYVRNFHPELPYVLHVPYRNQTPIMQELFRAHADGSLSDVQRLWMADRRPVEELYDTRVDPHEVRNLAGDPRHREVLSRMRVALDGWMQETGDLGLVPEPQMVERMWPGRVQPQTPKPLILSRRSSERELAQDGQVVLPGPGEVIIYVPSQGASIAYTTDEGENPRWSLYTGPVRVEQSTPMRAKAIRYGYAESEEVRTLVVVR